MPPRPGASRGPVRWHRGCGSRPACPIARHGRRGARCLVCDPGRSWPRRGAPADSPAVRSTNWCGPFRGASWGGSPTISRSSSTSSPRPTQNRSPPRCSRPGCGCSSEPNQRRRAGCPTCSAGGGRSTRRSPSTHCVRSIRLARRHRSGRCAQRTGTLRPRPSSVRIRCRSPPTTRVGGHRPARAHGGHPARRRCAHLGGARPLRPHLRAVAAGAFLVRGRPRPRRHRHHRRRSHAHRTRRRDPHLRFRCAARRHHRRTRARAGPHGSHRANTAAPAKRVQSPSSSRRGRSGARSARRSGPRASR